jgi:hypothetical protein
VEREKSKKRREKAKRQIVKRRIGDLDLEDNIWGCLFAISILALLFSLVLEE